VLDDLGREAMTAVAERSHADILTHQPLSADPVSVTMPSQIIDFAARARFPAMYDKKEFVTEVV
jgi:hypothetical protein